VTSKRAGLAGSGFWEKYTMRKCIRLSRGVACGPACSVRRPTAPKQ